MSKPFTIDDIHKLAQSGKIAGYVIKSKSGITPTNSAEASSKQEEKREVSPKKRVPNKEKSVSQLIKILTTHFNLYIRLRDGKDGYFICISCGNPKPQEQIQAGHYLSAGHNASVRFDEDNVHAQCTRCNMHLSGNQIPYRQNLVKKIGLEAVEKLEMRAKMRGFKWCRYTLLSMIEKYKDKVKEFKKQ